MKLSLSNLAWNPADEEAAIALMEKYEFTGVEIAPTKIWANPIRAKMRDAQLYAERLLLFHGIDIIAMQSLLYAIPQLCVFQERKKSIDYLGRLSRLARWVGANILVFGSPKSRNGVTFRSAVRFFGSCAWNGIPLCIEPNPPQYGCNFITTTKEAQELVAAVNHPNFRLHLDSGIMTLNGETDIPADIAHFHISQPYLAPVGLGTVDHLAMAKALRAIDYKGWCSVEMLPCENLEKSLEFVAGIYGD